MKNQKDDLADMVSQEFFNLMDLKQETIEEVAERLFSKEQTRFVFNLGAKYQKARSYSDEDMQEYAEFCIQCYIQGLPCIIAKDWFEQIKKK